MRRANGDWFVFKDNGRLRIVEMLLYSPIALDAQLLNEIVGGRSEVDFCIVNNPFANLRRSISLPQAQIASLLGSAEPPRRWKWLSRPWS